MKIIFFSDAHGNRYAVDSFFADIKMIEYDKVIFGGDVFGYYYEQDSILSLLRERHIHCLLGNHDKMFLDLVEGKIDEDFLIERYGNSYKNITTQISMENIGFLYSLRSRYEMAADGLKLVFVHGSADDELNGRIYPDTDIIDSTKYKEIDFLFTGHTHHKMIKRLDNGCTIINAGSIGQQRDGKGCSYVVFDTIKQLCDFRVCEYQIEKLLRDIAIRENEREMKEKLSKVLLR